MSNLVKTLLITFIIISLVDLTTAKTKAPQHYQELVSQYNDNSEMAMNIINEFMRSTKYVT